MATPIEPITFKDPITNQGISIPSMWTSEMPRWLRELGNTKVLVIDDQIQRLSQLSDGDALRRRICEPLNVEFVFNPECAEGHILAKNGKWFDAVATRLESLKDSLAAIFLDIMFDGETQPLEGSGIEFLSRITDLLPNLPVLIMTQADDELELHKRLERSGDFIFLAKDSGNRVDTICKFLCEKGWLADPNFDAFSVEMRAQVSAIRSYAIRSVNRLLKGKNRLIDDFEMPRPLLLLAPSGEGKTQMAKRIRRWLLQVDPLLFHNTREDLILDCNALDRSQGTKIALFGRGRQEPREQTDASGLVIRGMAQQANNGILIIDEIGNSPEGLQEMLLSFIESGRSEPEFKDQAMTADALGPLKVLCIFTGQQQQIIEGKIKEDFRRRSDRGATIEIPSLFKRLMEVIPIFYRVIKNQRLQDLSWREPDRLDDFILPEAQEWLMENVVSLQLSTSTLSDIARKIPNEVRVIGPPRLNNLLKEVSKSKQPLESNASETQIQTSSKAIVFIEELDGTELVERIINSKSIHFRGDEKTKLEGNLNIIQSAAAKILLSYLETCLDIARGSKSEINVVGTYRFITGKEIPKPKAATQLSKLLLINKDTTLIALRNSELLIRLAIAVADRSDKIQLLIEELALDPLQKERLLQLEWNEKKFAKNFYSKE